MTLTTDHLTTVRMASTKETVTKKGWKGCRKMEFLPLAGEMANFPSVNVENSTVYTQKFKKRIVL